MLILDMRRCFFVLLVLFPLSLLAQQGNTFRIRKAAPDRNGISFALHCDARDSVFKELFISEKGDCIFYWGNIHSPTSASFLGDTVAASMVRHILTRDFVRNTAACTDSVYQYDVSCGYSMVIVDGGRVTEYDIIDAAQLQKEVCGFNEIRRLVAVMQQLYDRYHFPK